jgi:carbamoyl-phosphate synthase, small subunit
MLNNKLKAVLVLEDESIWHGEGFGFPCKVAGEVVFTTGMVGYTESLTDPSFKGQILVMSYPLIGNYGVPPYNLKDKWGLPKHFESYNIQVKGLVVSELCDYPSHPYSIKSLNKWLYEEKIPGIEGVDTREIIKRIRKKGAMMGILEVSDEDIDTEKLLKEIKNVKKYDEIDFSKEVKDEIKIFENKGPTLILIDCGVKLSIIRNILERGFRVIKVPYDTSYDEILSFKPLGIIISNGPGNPKKFIKTIEITREIIENKIPTLGICLGNQIIALSLGGDTFKLKYGHRGQNKPCIELINYSNYITSQNHGYAIDPEKLKGTGLEIWWINADDKTIEGIRHKELPVIAVQFHPEASPGPYDTTFIFDIFKRLVDKHA